MTVIPPVLVPAVIAGLVWLVAFRLWNRHAPAPHGHWGGAVAFAAAYLAGHVLLVSWPPLPPNTADQWLAVLAIPLAAAGALERWWGTRAWAALPVRFIIAVLMLWPLSSSLLEYQWDTRATLLWLGGSAAMLAAVWEAGERVARRRPGVAISAVLWLVTVAASVSLVLTGSALLAQLAGTLAGILGAAVVLCLWSNTWSLGYGAVGVWFLLLSGLLWQGHFYSELGLVSAACVIVAPAFAWTGEIRRLREQNAWKREAARFGAVLIPLAVALFLAWRYWASVQGQDEYYY